MFANSVEMVVPATPTSVAPVRRRVAEIVASAGLAKRLVDDVRLCVSEAVANAVLHAYRVESGVVEIEVQMDVDGLTVVVRDYGKGITRRRGRPGVGYGLRIIETLADRCSIVSTPGSGTEIRMTFETGERSPPQSRGRR